ncbi:DALR anticodon-binding domain-containing protein [Lichenibacterium dinghuense]|uniref:DALR anticodon-binding domain-containing protein n=1 Tax=Lichenibacterium dinghuense TaxID=2895977 RepID=UPI001F3043ED|nr:DALR anticodon-binding domain-containing protein [Lichenibacterium sp. 6Y81]
MDIFALVRRRTLDVLADLVDCGELPRNFDLGRVAVAVPRAGTPGDVVVDAGSVHVPPRGVVDGLGAAPDVAAVAAVGGGRFAVTLGPAAVLGAVSAVLDGRCPLPMAPGGAMSPGGRPQPASGAASLAELRAEVLADVLAGLATAVDLAPPIAVPPRSVPVVLRGAVAGAGSTRPDDVLALIGADAFRFAVASCRPHAALHLDLDVLGDRCRADPSFWVPYAHTRARSMLREAAAAPVGLGPGVLAAADLADLTDGGELALARLVARHARLVADAAAAAAPQRIAAHLRQVADAVHHQWNRSKDQPQLRFVNEERRDLTKARLGLVTASALVLRSGLGLLGLSAPDEMR